MACIKRKHINDEWWYVAYIGNVPVLRNIFLTGAIMDCLSLGLAVDEGCLCGL